MDEMDVLDEIGEVEVLDEVGEDDEVERVNDEVNTGQSGNPSTGSPARLVVKGFPPDTTQTIMKKIFPQAKNIFLPTTRKGFSSGYAILTMSSEEEARSFLSQEYKIGEKVLRLFMKKTGPKTAKRGGRGFKQFGPNRGKSFHGGFAFKKRGNAFRGRGGFRGRWRNLNPNARFNEQEYFDGNITSDERRHCAGPNSEQPSRENFNSFEDELYRDDREHYEFNEHGYPEELDRHNDRFQTDENYSSSSLRDHFGEAFETRDTLDYEERQTFNDFLNRRGGRGKYRGHGKGNQIKRFSGKPSRHFQIDKRHDRSRSHDPHRDSHHYDEDNDFRGRQRAGEDFFEEDLPETHHSVYRAENSRDPYEEEQGAGRRLRTERFSDDSERHRIEMGHRARSEVDRYSETSHGRPRSLNDQHDNNFMEHDLVSEEEYVEDLSREELDREWLPVAETEYIEEHTNWKRVNNRDRNQQRDRLSDDQQYNKNNRSSQNDRRSDINRRGDILEGEEVSFDNEDRQKRCDRPGIDNRKERKSNHYDRFPEDRWMEEKPAAAKKHISADNSKNSTKRLRVDEKVFDTRDDFTVSASHRSRSPNIKTIPASEREHGRFSASLARERDDVPENRTVEHSRHPIQLDRRRSSSPHKGMVYQAQGLDLSRPSSPDGGVLLTRTLEGDLIVSRPEHSPLKPIHCVSPDRLSCAPTLQSISPDQGGILVTRTLTGEIVLSNAEPSRIGNLLPIAPFVDENLVVNTTERSDLCSGSAGPVRPNRPVLQDSSHEVRSDKRQSFKGNMDRSVRPRSPSVAYSYSSRNPHGRRNTSKGVNYSKQQGRSQEKELNTRQSDINLPDRQRHREKDSEYQSSRNRGGETNVDDYLPDNTNLTNSPNAPRSEYGASKYRQKEKDKKYFAQRKETFRKKNFDHASAEYREEKMKFRDLDRDRSRSPLSRYGSNRNREGIKEENDVSMKDNSNDRSTRYHPPRSEHEFSRYSNKNRDAHDLNDEDMSHAPRSGHENATDMDKDRHHSGDFNNRTNQNFRNFKEDRKSQFQKAHPEQKWQRGQPVKLKEPPHYGFDKHYSHGKGFPQNGGQQPNYSNKLGEIRSGLHHDFEPVDSSDSGDDFNNISRSVEHVSQKGRLKQQPSRADQTDLRITIRSENLNHRSLKQSLENIDSEDSNNDGLSDISADNLVANPPSTDAELFSGFHPPRHDVQPRSGRNFEKHDIYSSDQKPNNHPGNASYSDFEALRNQPQLSASYMGKGKEYGTYSSLSHSHRSPFRSAPVDSAENDHTRASQTANITKPSLPNTPSKVSYFPDDIYFNVPKEVQNTVGKPNFSSYSKTSPSANHTASHVNTGPHSGYHAHSPSISVPNRMTSGLSAGPSPGSRIPIDANTGPSGASRMIDSANSGTFTTNYLTVSTAIRMRSSVNVMNPTGNPVPSNVIMPNKTMSHQLEKFQPPVSNYSNASNAINASVPFTSGRSGSHTGLSNHFVPWTNSRKTDFEKLKDLTPNKNFTKTTTVDLPSKNDASGISDVADVRKLLLNQLQLLQQGIETDPTAIANIAEELKRLGQQKNTQPRSRWPDTGKNITSHSSSIPQGSMLSYNKSFTDIPNTTSSNTNWSQPNSSSRLSGIQQEYSCVTQQQSKTHLLLNKPCSQTLPRIPLAYVDAHPTYQTGQFTGVLGSSDPNINNNRRNTSDSSQPQSTNPVYQTPTSQSRTWRNF